MTAQHSSASAKDPRDGFQFMGKDFLYVPAPSVLINESTCLQLQLTWYFVFVACNRQRKRNHTLVKYSQGRGGK